VRFGVVWIALALALATVPFLMLWSDASSVRFLGALGQRYLLFLVLFWAVMGVRAVWIAGRGPGRNTNGSRWTLLLPGGAFYFGLLFTVTLWPETDVRGAQLNYYWASEASIPPSFTGVALLAGFLIPLILLIHAEGARARSGSALFGWAMAIPILGFAGTVFQQLDVLIPQYLNPYLQHEGSLEVAAVSVVVARSSAALLLVVLAEVMLTRLWMLGRSGASGAVSPVPRSFLFHLAITALPFVAALLVFDEVWDSGSRWGIWQSYEWVLVGAFSVLIVFLILSFWFGLLGLDRNAVSGNPRTNRLWVYGTIVAGATVFLFTAANRWLTLKIAWMDGVMGLILVADLHDVLRCRAARRSGDDPPRETQLIRALLQFPRSPFLRWGGSRRRWREWIMPPLMWVLAFGVLVGGILVGRRATGRAIDLGELFSLQYYGAQFWRYYIALVYLFGIAVPLAVFIPWRIAQRFQQVWDPVQLREVALTRQSVWDIYWGIILPPARSLLITAGMTVVFLGGLFFVGRSVGPVAYRMEIRWEEFFEFAVLPTVAGILLSLLVIGFARRRKGSGIAAFGAALLTFIVGFAGILVLLRILAAMRSEIPYTGWILLFATIALVWTVRRAFQRIPETLEQLVGE